MNGEGAGSAPTETGGRPLLPVFCGTVRDRTTRDRVWFQRVDQLFTDLDMRGDCVSDARPEQVRRLRRAVDDLYATLENFLSEQHELRNVAARALRGLSRGLVAVDKFFASRARGRPPADRSGLARSS